MWLALLVLLSPLVVGGVIGFLLFGLRDPARYLKVVFLFFPAVLIVVLFLAWGTMSVFEYADHGENELLRGVAAWAKVLLVVAGIAIASWFTFGHPIANMRKKSLWERTV